MAQECLLNSEPSWDKIRSIQELIWENTPPSEVSQNLYIFLQKFYILFPQSPRHLISSTFLCKLITRHPFHFVLPSFYLFLHQISFYHLTFYRLQGADAQKSNHRQLPQESFDVSKKEFLIRIFQRHRYPRHTQNLLEPSLFLPGSCLTYGSIESLNRDAHRNM